MIVPLWKMVLASNGLQQLYSYPDAGRVFNKASCSSTKPIVKHFHVALVPAKASVSILHLAKHHEDTHGLSVELSILTIGLSWPNVDAKLSAIFSDCLNDAPCPRFPAILVHFGGQFLSQG